MTFEVTYNVTFRGASTIVSVGGDKSDFINPNTEVAQFVANKTALDLNAVLKDVPAGTTKTYFYGAGASGPGAAMYLDKDGKEAKDARAAYNMAIVVGNPAFT